MNFNPRQQQGYSAVKVKLTMPKFSIDFSVDMKELMKDFGIKTLFSPEIDLSPMVGEMKNNEIEISEMNHKVKFDVDEDIYFRPINPCQAGNQREQNERFAQ